MTLCATRPAAAQAPQTPLPRVTADVVVTATTVPAAGAAVGRTVTVLTREELERRGVSSIIDGLRLMAGVDPKARGPHDVQTDFSLRGANFGQSLVLIDGVRLNDSQSGHHNGEIPAPLVGIDRIEVVFGPASAVHGADAMGGTIQIITRTDRHATALAVLGQHAYASAQASASGGPLPDGWTLTGWGGRSDGFMFDRDFASGGGGLRGVVRKVLTLDVRHQRRAFGANGFYGNSPSKEWTDQSVASARWTRPGDAWTTDARVAFRNHGDHFRWDIARPGFAENRHRTNALDASMQASRIFTPRLRLTAGAGAGGDWIESSNLGDRTYRRGHGFVEAQWTPASRVSAHAGARLDGYSTFGQAWSPSVSVAGWLSPSVRVRGSAARAFRIPTFTERFYTDPAHQASDVLSPEQGTAVDAGLDIVARGWTLSASPFVRWDDSVIDWVRPSTAERWRTTNVRDVTTTGVEVSAARHVGAAYIRAHYAGLRVDAPRLTMLSKYVLEYARHTAGLSTTAPIGGGVRMAVNADYRSRVDGQQYWLVGGRLSRSIRRLEAFVEGSNLLNESYREVAGVLMPGRWISAGVAVR
jgi:iron complex outermembrane receptor protein